ncbi:methyltransferase [Nemania diffusa]|nr:methyltransferase [Nemania diffusa]
MASEPTPDPTNVKERLKASYDAMADTYNEWTIPHSKQRMDYLERALEHLKPEAQPGGRALAFLELGCGCGLPVTQRLLSHAAGARVIANDLSDTQISLARTNLLSGSAAAADDPTLSRRLELVPGDMTKLDFADGSLDLVAAFYSVIHLPRDEQVVLFERVARWLRPGGCFVANFAKEEREGAVMEKWLDDDRGWMYWSAWGEEKTLDKLKGAGFEILVADVVEDVVDATFVWVIAKR